MDQTTSSYCPWCSTEIPAGSSACPKCGALVEGAKAVDLPGVTEVDPTVAAAPDPTIPSSLNPLDWLSAGKETTAEDAERQAAIDPPSEAVLLEMRKIELESQIANAGTDVLGPGDQTIEVGAPSEEALQAFEKGLLDPTGPAGEDMKTQAQPWEDPELEARLAEWQTQNPDK